MGAAAQKHRAESATSRDELLQLLETLYRSRNATRQWLHCTRRDWIISKIRQCGAARQGRALEIGFGAGVYLPALAESYSEVVATDLDDAHLEHARAYAAQYPNLELLKDDITASQLPRHSFDLVLCSEVIEHIPDTSKVFAAVRRLMAPDARLILSTPQRHSILELACKVAFLPGVIQVVRRIYGESVFETGHINLMTERTCVSALAAAGFTIDESFKSGMYIPMIAEFGGSAGLRLEKFLEDKVTGRRMDWMLWTQYYVARALP